MINENVKGLKQLRVNNFSYLNELVCKDALLELHIDDYDSSELKIDGLKKLKKLSVNKLACLDNLVGMDGLLELHILDPYSRYSTELKIAGLKKLKTLKVCRLAQLDNLVGMDALLELSVTRDLEWTWSGRELKKYELSNIVKRFKNLHKCEICVPYGTNSTQPKEYAQIVQDVFQNSATRVKIVFDIFTSSTTYLTKDPFQRCKHVYCCKV